MDKSTLDALYAEIGDKDLEIDSLKDSVTQLEGEIRSYRAEVERLKDQIVIQKGLSDEDHEVAIELQAEVERLRAMYARCCELVEEKDREIELLRGEPRLHLPDLSFEFPIAPKG